VSVRVEVRSRAPGAVGGGPPDVLVELADERTTAGELFRRAVAEQVRLLAVARAGLDAEAEVGRARRAFERGVFVVFVGGHQVTRLDEEIHLRPGEPVVFLRLTALVGG
jgi:hypothetical protein